MSICQYANGFPNIPSWRIEVPAFESGTALQQKKWTIFKVKVGHFLK